ncbi:MAG: hypothetical protein OXU20_03680 [Myxococcales bacterium]|nr:hypothetical protein [Myxococcales bacterium]
MKRTAICVLAAICLAAGSVGTAAAEFNYSKWSERVWVLFAHRRAVASLSNAGSPDRAYSYWCGANAGVLHGVCDLDAPYGNTWLRVAVKCRDEGGSWDWYIGDWIGPEDPAPESKRVCPLNRPIASEVLTQVASEEHSHFNYD